MNEKEMPGWAIIAVVILCLAWVVLWTWIMIGIGRWLWSHI